MFPTQILAQAGARNSATTASQSIHRGIRLEVPPAVILENSAPWGGLCAFNESRVARSRTSGYWLFGNTEHTTPS